MPGPAGGSASAARRVNSPAIFCRYERSRGGFMFSRPPSGDCISAPVSGQPSSPPVPVTAAMPKFLVLVRARSTSGRRRRTSIGGPPAGRTAKSWPLVRRMGGGPPSGWESKRKTGGWPVVVAVTVTPWGCPGRGGPRPPPASEAGLDGFIAFRLQTTMGCSGCATPPPDAGERVDDPRRIPVLRRRAVGMLGGAAGCRVSPGHLSSSLLPGPVYVRRRGGPPRAAQRKPGHACANADGRVRQRDVRRRRGSRRQGG